MQCYTVLLPQLDTNQPVLAKTPREPSCDVPTSVIATAPHEHAYSCLCARKTLCIVPLVLKLVLSTVVRHTCLRSDYKRMVIFLLFFRK